MNKSFQNIGQLLVEAKSNTLYRALIIQLNKDFNLAGLSVENIKETVSPEELKVQLEDVLKVLLTSNFDGFLNLLYRIDLPESKIKVVSNDTIENYIEGVSFLVLKRVWMKVWFKNIL